MVERIDAPTGGGDDDETETTTDSDLGDTTGTPTLGGGGGAPDTDTDDTTDDTTTDSGFGGTSGTPTLGGGGGAPDTTTEDTQTPTETEQTDTTQTTDQTADATAADETQTIDPQETTAGQGVEEFGSDEALLLEEQGLTTIKEQAQRIESEFIQQNQQFSEEDVGVFFTRTDEGLIPQIRFTETGAAIATAEALRKRDRIPEGAVSIEGGEVDIDLSEVEQPEDVFEDADRGVEPGELPRGEVDTRQEEIEGFRTGERAARKELERSLEQQYDVELSPTDIRFERQMEDGQQTITAELAQSGRQKIARQVEQGNVAALVEDIEEFTGLDVPGEGELVSERDLGEQFGDIAVQTADEIPGTGTRGSLRRQAAGMEEIEGTDIEADTFDEFLKQTTEQIEAQFEGPVGFTREFEGPSPRVETVEPVERDTKLRNFAERSVTAPAKFVATSPVALVSLGKESVEAGTATAEAVATGDVDFEDFVGDVEARGVTAAEMGLSELEERPAGTAGAAVGTLGATAVGFGATRAVSRTANIGARGLLQPVEEVAGVGGNRLTRAIASERTAERLFPQNEPLIFSEEAALRAASRASRGVRRGAARASRRLEVETKGLQFKASEIKTEGMDARVEAPSLPRRLRQEVRSARFKAAEIRERGTEARIFGETKTERGQMTMVPQLELEFEQETETELEAEQESEVSVESELDRELGFKTEPAFDVGTETRFEPVSAELERGRERAELETPQEAELDQEQELDVELEQELEQELEFETETESEQELELEQELEQELELELEAEAETRTEFEAEALGRPRQRPSQDMDMDMGESASDLFENIPDDLDAALEGLDDL